MCRPSSSGPLPAVRESETQARKKNLWKAVAPSIAVVIALIASGLHYHSHRAKPLTDKDTIVLADFDNKTDDVVFDDTLKTALSVSLSQSPFLNVLSDNKVAATLKLMTRPSDTRLTPDVARELCQRAASKAYIAGSIASLGSQYVLGLKAVNCRSGDPMAEQQVTTASKEKVLDALGEAASKLRGELGESLASVQKLDAPLEQATTTSLEALQAYSLGEKAYREKNVAAALPYHQRAIQLDPRFALGYNAVGSDYLSLGEQGRASEYFSKGFDLKERASERESLNITAGYYSYVTGELEKGEQACQEWVAIYPRDYRAHLDLGNAYLFQGQYEKAAAAYRESLRLVPDNLALDGNWSMPSSPCSDSMKPGGSSARLKQEISTIPHCTWGSTLWLFLRRIPGRWRLSISGLRASLILFRALGCRWHLTARHMRVMRLRHGN